MFDELFKILSDADWRTIRGDGAFIMSQMHRIFSHNKRSNYGIYHFSPFIKSILPKFVSDDLIEKSFSPRHVDQLICDKNLDKFSDVNSKFIEDFLQLLEMKSSQFAHRKIVFDERHRDFLKNIFSSLGVKGFTILDQLQSSIFSIEWSTISDIPAFLMSLIRKLHPIHTNLSSREYIDALIDIVKSTIFSSRLVGCDHHYHRHQHRHHQIRHDLDDNQRTNSVSQPPFIQRDSKFAESKAFETLHTWSLAERILDRLGDSINMRAKREFVKPLKLPIFPKRKNDNLDFFFSGLCLKKFIEKH
jgi:hypothetical protein